MRRSVAIWVGMTILALGSLGLGYWIPNRAPSRAATKGGESLYAATLVALREGSLRARGAALAATFASATSSDLDAITRAFEETHTGLGPGPLATELLAELWARHDADGALERSSAWRSFWRRQFVPTLMNAWARRDGRSARDRVDTLDGEKLRAEAEKAVALGLFAARGEAAWQQYRADWPFGEAALLDVLGQIALNDGFEGLIDRVEGLPLAAAEQFRAKAIRGVAGLGGQIDPARTAAFVEAHADSPLEGLRNLRAPFVDAWSQSDPRAALDWLMSQPSGRHRNGAIRIAYRSWALDSTTAVEAVEWIEAQPADVLPPVLDFYALALVPIDPDRAIAAAESIETANRDMILRRVKQRVGARPPNLAGKRSPSRRSEPVEVPDDEAVRHLEKRLAPGPVPRDEAPSASAGGEHNP